MLRSSHGSPKLPFAEVGAADAILGLACSGQGATAPLRNGSLTQFVGSRHPAHGLVSRERWDWTVSRASHRLLRASATCCIASAAEMYAPWAVAWACVEVASPAKNRRSSIGRPKAAR